MLRGNYAFYAPALEVLNPPPGHGSDRTVDDLPGLVRRLSHGCELPVRPDGRGRRSLRRTRSEKVARAGARTEIGAR